MEIHLPISYANYLNRTLSPKINGLGLLIDDSDKHEYSNDSIQWGIEYFNNLRHDLNGDFIPIRFINDKALCFARNQGEKLYEVSLELGKPPVDLRLGFSEYLSDYEKKFKYAEHRISYFEEKYFGKGKKGGYDRVKAKGKSFNIRNKLKKKAGTWNLIRSCVHDRVVGIVSYKVDPKNLMVIVDVFLVSDHPLYEKWNSLKAVLALLFCEAYRLGIPPNIKFKYSENGVNSVPKDIIHCLSHYQIKTSCEEAGLLDAKSVTKLLACLLGISELAMRKVDAKSKVSLGGICFLVANDVWTPFSAKYLIAVTPVYKEILFGKYNPETNPLIYSELVTKGCNAIIIELLIQKLSHDPRRLEFEESSDLSIEEGIEGDCIRFILSENIKIPWGLEEQLGIAHQSFSVNNVLVKPMIRRVLPDEANRLDDDVRSLTVYNDVFKVILYSANHLKWFQKNVSTYEFESFLMKARVSGVYVCCVPYEISELEKIVQSRMNKAKYVSS